MDKAKNVFLGSAIDRYLFYSVIDETGVPTLRHIIEHHDGVVKDAIGFATKKLKSKVKDPEWLYLRRVDVKENGVYYLNFKYDDPVWKHTDEFLPQDHMVTVSGTKESGFEKAEPNW